MKRGHYGFMTGFTLIEMIVAITIMGIVAGMLAVFIRSPVEGYFATVRRAQLTEEADASLRFMARDLQAALPNSIQVSGGPATYSLSFLPINSGGRYREYPTGTGTGTPLRFGQAVTSFDAIGASAEATTTTARGTATSGRAVVGNLSSGVSNCNSTASAFASNSQTATLSGSTVTVTSHTFPEACNLQASTVQDNTSTTNNEANDRGFGKLFFVGTTGVSYSCGTAGLTRNGVALASHVTACTIGYDVSTNAQVQTVSVRLTLSRDGESVELLRPVHVVNEP